MKGKNATYFLSKNRKSMSAYSNVWQKSERKRLLFNYGVVDFSKDLKNIRKKSGKHTPVMIL